MIEVDESEDESDDCYETEDDEEDESVLDGDDQNKS